MAKKTSQTLLSVKSEKAVASVMKKFKAVELSKSGAINTLVERSVSLEKINRELKAEILELKSELGFLQDNERQENAEEGL